MTEVEVSNPGWIRSVRPDEVPLSKTVIPKYTSSIIHVSASRRKPSHPANTAVPAGYMYMNIYHIETTEHSLFYSS